MTIKVGIDSYSYHRHFGEVYPEPKTHKKIMTTFDFLKRAKELDVDGVSLESCFIEKFDDSYLNKIKDTLDEYKFDRVWAWGHPDGLEGGKNEEALKDMIKHIDYARAIGAKVMRVVGSSLTFRFDPHEPQLERLTKMFKEAVKVAEDADIKMAVENHFDFDSDEFLSLIQAVDSPNFGLTLDTGNFFRMLDEPVLATQKLGKYVFATHTKDLRITPNTYTNEWYFFSCVPAGEGFVNLKEIARILKDFGYQGMLAYEADYLHPDYEDEDAVVAQSVKYLKQMVSDL
jgi:sugar phosphate isomerase/epimerase